MLFSMWLLITLAPLWLLVKASFFGVGIAFFVLLPITHRWPQYRLLASPSTWLFWKIPTHGTQQLTSPTLYPPSMLSADVGNTPGDWAIARLQAQAAQYLQNSPFVAPDVDMNDTPIAEETSVGSFEDTRTTHDLTPQSNGSQNKVLRIGRYHCISENHHGNLSLNADGMYFETHLIAKQRWRLNYAELKSMQKASWPRSSYLKQQPVNSKADHRLDQD